MSIRLQRQFTISAEVAGQLHVFARERRMTPSAVAAWAIGQYLDAGAVPGGFLAGPQQRLRLRLPDEVYARLDACSAELGVVTPHLLVEAALHRLVGAQRAPSWDLGHQPRVSGAAGGPRPR